MTTASSNHHEQRQNQRQQLDDDDGSHDAEEQPTKESQDESNGNESPSCSPFNTTSATALWIGTVLWLVGLWVAAWIVDKSCRFVVIRGRYADEDEGANNDAQASADIREIHRGIQGGMLDADDTQCRAWGKYDDLDLDSKMIGARASAALSIVFGFFCLIIALAWPRWPRRYLKIATSLMAFCVSVFQALTHLMVKSELCKDTSFTHVGSDGRSIVYDECDNDTPAYNLTFATIGAWLVATALLCSLPSPSGCDACNTVDGKSASSNDNNIDSQEEDAKKFSSKAPGHEQASVSAVSNGSEEQNGDGDNAVDQSNQNHSNV
mmetsp:Transcript_26489/g.74125  ORF Transcript_26489/g.74125 Transcript_26489/m.74125 type:complete len:322 (+) Transcript_26489:159-1124(+)